MKVDVYRATKFQGYHEKLYVMVPEGASPDALPKSLKEKTGELIKEKEVDLRPGEKRIALDVDTALKNLESHGYHEQLTRIVAPKHAV